MCWRWRCVHAPKLLWCLEGTVERHRALVETPGHPTSFAVVSMSCCLAQHGDVCRSRPAHGSGSPTLMSRNSYCAPPACRSRHAPAPCGWLSESPKQQAAPTDCEVVDNLAEHFPLLRLELLVAALAHRAQALQTGGQLCQLPPRLGVRHFRGHPDKVPQTAAPEGSGPNNPGDRRSVSRCPPRTLSTQVEQLFHCFSGTNHFWGSPGLSLVRSVLFNDRPKRHQGLPRCSANCVAESVKKASVLSRLTSKQRAAQL